MSKHTPIGDISIPLGFYTKDGEKKRRGRNIGTLMETRDEHGVRQWMKLNAEVLSPSVLILMSRNGYIEGGADAVILNVYPPDKPAASGSPAKPAAAEPDDQIPF